MKTYLLSGFLLLSVMPAPAQDSSVIKNVKNDSQEVSYMDGSTTFQLGMPCGAMKEAIENNMGNVGFGVSLILLSNPFTWGKLDRNSPLRVGGEFSYTYYGRFLTDIEINGYMGDFKTIFGIGNLNAIIRFQPPVPSNFTPFVDVIAGGNFYQSSTTENLSIIETALGVEKLYIGGTSSVGFNKGIGFGFALARSKPEMSKFVFRATYNRGRTIKYLVRNSITYDPGSNTLLYETRKAPVEYFMIQIGFGIDP